MTNTFLLQILLQTNATNADILLREGRMYSVLAVLLVIFLSLVGYMVITERKISAIEKKLE